MDTLKVMDIFCFVLIEKKTVCYCVVVDLNIRHGENHNVLLRFGKANTKNPKIPRCRKFRI